MHPWKTNFELSTCNFHRETREIGERDFRHRLHRFHGKELSESRAFVVLHRRCFRVVRVFRGLKSFWNLCHLCNLWLCGVCAPRSFGHCLFGLAPVRAQPLVRQSFSDGGIDARLFRSAIFGGFDHFPKLRILLERLILLQLQA